MNPASERIAPPARDPGGGRAREIKPGVGVEHRRQYRPRACARPPTRRLSTLIVIPETQSRKKRTLQLCGAEWGKCRLCPTPIRTIIERCPALADELPRRSATAFLRDRGTISTPHSAVQITRRKLAADRCRCRLYLPSEGGPSPRVELLRKQNRMDRRRRPRGAPMYNWSAREAQTSDGGPLTEGIGLGASPSNARAHGRHGYLIRRRSCDHFRYARAEGCVSEASPDHSAADPRAKER